LKAQIVLEDGIDRPCAPQDEGEAHDANQGRHDHGDDGEIGKKPPAREIVTEQQKRDGDAEHRGGDHTSNAKYHGVVKRSQIEAIGEKLVIVPQGEDPVIGSETVVEQTGEGIDQKNNEEAPDAGVAEDFSNAYIGPDS